MKIIVAGYSGRMGQEILSLAEEYDDIQFVGGVSRTSQGVPIEGFKSFQNFDQVDLEADVVIDFSLPELTTSVCAWCSANGAALVSGVTGFKNREEEALKKLEEKAAVLWSPNMSLGIAWLNQAVASLARLEGFDFQIEEFHHNKKVDRPSGTAAFLQKTLVENAEGPVPEEISIRGGGIFGIHRVHAMSEGETLSLEHVALNRSVFARGALLAARWIQNQAAGRYELANVLGIV